MTDDVSLQALIDAWLGTDDVRPSGAQLDDWVKYFGLVPARRVPSDAPEETDEQLRARLLDHLRMQANVRGDTR